MEEGQTGANDSRVVSIDALRGFDMFWIIGGGAFVRALADLSEHPMAETVKEQLHHVEWEGFHFEDLIFPLFVFLLGAVMPFAISRRLERGQSRGWIHVHVVKRTAALILMGMIVNGLLGFDWAEMRWPGVLQRIGLAYFFAALGGHSHEMADPGHFGGRGTLLAYWGVTMLVPAPGFEAGDLTMEGCLSSYIDQQAIPGKLYYEYGDNEGLISTLPAVCTALLGALAGQWLRSNRSGHRKAGGAGDRRGRLSGPWLPAGGWCFPMIKILWTSSFVLFAAGLEPTAAGAVLLGDRRPEVQTVGLLLHRHRHESDHDLLPATVRRFQRHRRVLPERPGRPRGTVRPGDLGVRVADGSLAIAVVVPVSP